MIRSLLALALVLPGAACVSAYKNYEGQRQGREIALLRQQGIQFWLEGHPRQPVDELHLEPGDYIIRFVQTSNRTGGAASCSLARGRYYGFRITGRRFLPVSKTYAFTGECYENSRPEPGWSQRAY
jgi:hypothetical protein